MAVAPSVATPVAPLLLLQPVAPTLRSLPVLLAVATALSLLLLLPAVLTRPIVVAPLILAAVLR
jgi:hypothetical protein